MDSLQGTQRYCRLVEAYMRPDAMLGWIRQADHVSRVTAEQLLEVQKIILSPLSKFISSEKAGGVIKGWQQRMKKSGQADYDSDQTLAKMGVAFGLARSLSWEIADNPQIVEAHMGAKALRISGVLESIRQQAELVLRMTNPTYLDGFMSVGPEACVDYFSSVERQAAELDLMMKYLQPEFQLRMKLPEDFDERVVKRLDDTERIERQLKTPGTNATMDAQTAFQKAKILASAKAQAQTYLATSGNRRLWRDVRKAEQH